MGGSPGSPLTSHAAFRTIASVICHHSWNLGIALSYRFST
jgi:hypothetical protein